MSQKSAFDAKDDDRVVVVTWSDLVEAFVATRADGMYICENTSLLKLGNYLFEKIGAQKVIYNTDLSKDRAREFGL